MNYISPYLRRPLRDLEDVQKAAPVKAGRPGVRRPATATRMSTFYPGEFARLRTHHNHDCRPRVRVVRNLDSFNVEVVAWNDLGCRAFRVTASELEGY